MYMIFDLVTRVIYLICLITLFIKINFRLNKNIQTNEIV
jgi:hypothetical protein